MSDHEMIAFEESALTDRQKEDLKFIENTDAWPQMILPVKQWQEDKREYLCGVIFPGYLGTVVLWNMWDEPANLKTAEKKEYGSPLAVVANGWIVD